MTRIHFFTNGVFTTTIAGGDIHFLKLAEAVARAGYAVNYFGGHALAEVIQKHNVPGTVALTDAAKMQKVNTGALDGQVAMFRDMFGRYRRTMALLAQVRPEDFVYAVSDYWFDVLPVVRSAARRRLMVLHMEAPTFRQILTRGRPDVDPKRLASLHYWASQEYSLRRFAAARGGQRHLFHLHPLMQPRLRRLGVRDEEMTLLSYGLEVGPTEAVPAQPRAYDVVWIGRVHRQKGIDDLLDTLGFLNQRLPNLRAMFIGNVRDALAPEIEQRGLGKVVEFSGFVSEEEKIRLFKASRVFLMPSKHEGSPRVIGESIIAGTPVVAYEIPNYRPLFDDFVRYAPPFDLAAFQQVAEREILALRAGQNYLDQLDLAAFKRENSWGTTQGKFLAALEKMR
ncbi:MAG: glycosyltransferase [Verrucomicrobia bacterium]|nr:glycosyltransferase [Verrucomicrobiota bacterium]